MKYQRLRTDDGTQNHFRRWGRSCLNLGRSFSAGTCIHVCLYAEAPAEGKRFFDLLAHLVVARTKQRHINSALWPNTGITATSFSVGEHFDNHAFLRAQHKHGKKRGPSEVSSQVCSIIFLPINTSSGVQHHWRRCKQLNILK